MESNGATRPKPAQPQQNPARAIMVVDDDIQLGQILTRFLKMHDYEVNYFANPKKALDCLNILKDAGPDGRIAGRDSVGVNLLLTDIAMPEINGLDLARQAKRIYPALPVIVMSGSADEQDKAVALALGADFIPKPFELDDLLTRVNARITA